MSYLGQSFHLEPPDLLEKSIISEKLPKILAKSHAESWKTEFFIKNVEHKKCVANPVEQELLLPFSCHKEGI